MNVNRGFTMRGKPWVEPQKTGTPDSTLLENLKKHGQLYKIFLDRQNQDSHVP